MQGKINIGRLIITNRVHDLIIRDAEFAKFATQSLNKYVAGDWGETDESNKCVNDAAVCYKNRKILALYEQGDYHLYIATEHDRMVTTMLLASEYKEEKI